MLAIILPGADPVTNYRETMVKYMDVRQPIAATFTHYPENRSNTPHKRIQLMDVVLSPEQKLIMKGQICPYCKGPAEYVDSKVVYGRSYGMIYLCNPCKAWCGVHPGTDRALGRLANANLRDLKKEAHKYFDRIWKRRILSRTAAYRLLSTELGLPKQYTHIGMFSEVTCQKVITISKQFINEKGG